MKVGEIYRLKTYQTGFPKRVKLIEYVGDDEWVIEFKRSVREEWQVTDRLVKGFDIYNNYIKVSE